MSELDQFHNNSILTTDLYELTMASAYFSSNQFDKIGIFEMYVRKLPKNRNYLVIAGLEHVINFNRNCEK